MGGQARFINLDNSNTPARNCICTPYHFCLLWIPIRTQNRGLTMLQPSKLAFQSNHDLHGFQVIPILKHPFKENKNQLCVTSLFLGTTEFPHTISKNNDAPQSLTTGILRRVIFWFRYEQNFAFCNLSFLIIYHNNSLFCFIY